MENKVSYTMVGLFVIIFTIIAILLGVWISAYKNNKEYLSYAVYFQEAVSGLSEQSIVKFNGVPVGYVKRIELDPENIKNVRLLLAIERSVPVNVSTTATLKAQGLTGITYVELKASSKSQELLKANYGERYPVIPSTPSLLVQLDTTLREVTQNLKKIGDSFHDVFDKDNIESIKTSLSGIAKVTDTIAKRSLQIDRSLDNMDKILDKTSQASKDLPKMSKQLNHTLANAEKLSKQLNRASNEASTMFKEVKMSFTSMSSQLMPSMHQILTNLSSISHDMQQVSEQMKYDPSIIVRGKRHAKSAQ